MTKNRFLNDTLFSCIVGSNIYKSEYETLPVYGQKRTIISLIDSPFHEKYYLKPLPLSILDSDNYAYVKNAIAHPPLRGSCYWPVDCIEFDEDTAISIQRKNCISNVFVADRSRYALVYPYDDRPIRAMKDLLSPESDTDYYCKNVCWSNMRPYIEAFLDPLIALQNEGFVTPMLSDDDIYFIDEEGTTKAIIDCNSILMQKSVSHITPPEVLLDYEYLDQYYIENKKLDRYSESHSLAALLFKMCIGILPYASTNIGSYYQDEEQLKTWLQNYQSEVNQRFVFGRDYPNGNGVGNDSSVEDIVLPKWTGLSSELQQMFEEALCRKNVLRNKAEITTYSAEDWSAAFNRFYNSFGDKSYAVQK